jgi:hypothetical protein
VSRYDARGSTATFAGGGGTGAREVPKWRAWFRSERGIQRTPPGAGGEAGRGFGGGRGALRSLLPIAAADAVERTRRSRIARRCRAALQPTRPRRQALLSIVRRRELAPRRTWSRQPPPATSSRQLASISATERRR